MSDRQSNSNGSTEPSKKEDLFAALEGIESFQAELKKLKKKLRKAEDHLNEVRSCHDAMKKEIKKRKKKLEKKIEIQTDKGESF